MRRPKNHIPIYVINLDHRKDRWRLQSFQARLWRLQLQRVAAFDGNGGRKRFPRAELTEGALGLWATFDNLVVRLAEEGVDCAIVLEDDAILLPGFMKQVSTVVENAPSTLALLQLGFLGKSSWRPQNSLLQNIKKLLRPRSRIRGIIRAVKEPGAAEGLTMRAGTHALLIFPPVLITHMEGLRPEDCNALPLDNALVAASKKMPSRFTRLPRSFASQLPVRADIAWKRE